MLNGYKISVFVLLCFSATSVFASEAISKPNKGTYLKLLLGIPIYDHTGNHDLRSIRHILSRSVAFGGQLNSSVSIELEGTYRYISGKLVAPASSRVNPSWYG